MDSFRACGHFVDIVFRTFCVYQPIAKFGEFGPALGKTFFAE